MKKLFFSISLLASLPVFLLFTLLLFLFDNSWFFLPLFLMIVISTTITYCIKWWFPTRRPEYVKLKIKKTFWTHWRFVNQSSFPSAHTSLVAGLTTIMTFFSWKLFFVALVFAGAVAYSRIYLKRHYWRDIIGGAIMGILSGLTAWDLAPYVVLFF